MGKGQTISSFGDLAATMGLAKPEESVSSPVPEAKANGSAGHHITSESKPPEDTPKPTEEPIPVATPEPTPVTTEIAKTEPVPVPVPIVENVPIPSPREIAEEILGPTPQELVNAAADHLTTEAHRRLASQVMYQDQVMALVHNYKEMFSVIVHVAEKLRVRIRSKNSPDGWMQVSRANAGSISPSQLLQAVIYSCTEIDSKNTELERLNKAVSNLEKINEDWRKENAELKLERRNVETEMEERFNAERKELKAKADRGINRYHQQGDLPFVLVNRKRPNRYIACEHRDPDTRPPLDSFSSRLGVKFAVKFNDYEEAVTTLERLQRHFKKVNVKNLKNYVVGRLDLLIPEVKNKD